MLSKGIKLSFIIVILSLLLSIVTISTSFAGIAAAQKRQVTLTTVLDDQGDPPRALKMFYQPA
jgi:hypothetical protein